MGLRSDNRSPRFVFRYGSSHGGSHYNSAANHWIAIWMTNSSKIVFCYEHQLGYERSRTRFTPREPFRFDAAYRLAHLPLVAARHPDVIAGREEKNYVMGRHDPTFSVVIPIPPRILCESEPYRALVSELRRSLFGAKIAWELVQQRRNKLHATICTFPSLDQPPVVTDAQRRELRHLGPVWLELRSLFSGNRNLGRLYFSVYPEFRKGENVVQKIQRIIGRPETDLYVVGMFNLIDNLGAEEAADLSGTIKRWWGRPILRFQADHLWLLCATDDLALDSRVVETLSLG